MEAQKITWHMTQKSKKKLDVISEAFLMCDNYIGETLMKTKLKIALASTVICGAVGVALAAGEQSPAEAKERLELLVKLIKAKGQSAFSYLNGPGEEVGRSKHNTTEDGLEWSALKSGDNLVCIQDGKYVVHQLHPTKVGKDALSGADAFTDGSGANVAQKTIDGFKTSPDGFYSTPVVEKVDGVRNEKTGKTLEEQRFFLAAKSKVLMGGAKNDTGKKFFCGIMYNAPAKPAA
jgi:hypothetical protein